MMKYNARFSNKMKQHVNLMKKRGKDMKKLDNVIRLLAAGEQLPEKYRDNGLVGDYSGAENVILNLIGF